MRNFYTQADIRNNDTENCWTIDADGFNFEHPVESVINNTGIRYGVRGGKLGLHGVGPAGLRGARIQPISAKLEATGTCHGSPSVSLFQELDYLSASCSWDEG